MEPPLSRPLEGIEQHLQAALTTRLGRAVVGETIADQLLATDAAPLPENVDELKEAVDASLAANNLSDAAIRSIFFLALSPHGAAPPLEPDTPIYSDAELNDDKILLNYPQLSYYKEVPGTKKQKLKDGQVAKVLRMWVLKGSFPIEFVPLGGLVETSDEPHRMNLQTPDLLRISSAWTFASDADRSELCLDVLKVFTLHYALNVALLGVRGILTLLRVRRTMGTTTSMLPPPIQRLVWAFNSTGKGRTTLTEGARAVSKHYHRDTTNKFWGDNKGSDAQKNQHANTILRRIFRASKWINVHQLPHDVIICEIRTPEGYGARWTGDGSMFRGFLEPHVEDGHEKGWKH